MFCPLMAECICNSCLESIVGGGETTLDDVSLVIVKNKSVVQNGFGIN
jgi:hypothetical protein